MKTDELLKIARQTFLSLPTYGPPEPWIADKYFDQARKGNRKSLGVAARMYAEIAYSAEDKGQRSQEAASFQCGQLNILFSDTTQEAYVATSPEHLPSTPIMLIIDLYRDSYRHLQRQIWALRQLVLCVEMEMEITSNVPESV